MKYTGVLISLLGADAGIASGDLIKDKAVNLKQRIFNT